MYNTDYIMIYCCTQIFSSPIECRPLMVVKLLTEENELQPVLGSNFDLAVSSTLDLNHLKQSIVAHHVSFVMKK